MTQQLHPLSADSQIINRIYVVRNQQVMLDRDLAEMYGVETRRLNEQVKRNLKRFPEDFMFTLTREEMNHLMSQFATSSWGGTRRLPRVFTEQGVAMLSSVLSSDTAIAVNIRIIRVFTRLREYAQIQPEILLQLSRMEQDVKSNSLAIENIFAVLEKLIEKPAPPPRSRIGFRHPQEAAGDEAAG